jgi:Ser/Thr protein kinase RdoA (MazF antagonist)
MVKMRLSSSRHPSSRIFKKQGVKKSKRATESLLEGYCRVENLSGEDLEHIPYFILSRKLVLVAWLNARRDNPRLLKYFNKTINGNIREFRDALANGPKPIL